MKNKFLLTFTVSLTIIFLSILFSSVSAKPYKRLYKGVRPAGMGGAFAAVANDSNAIFYNPAGLSRIKGFTIGLLNPAISIGENGIDMFSDSEDTDMDDTGEVADLLRQYTGKNMSLYASITPNIGFRIKNFGVLVSAFAIAETNSSVRNPVYPEFNVDARIDIGGIAGIGFLVPGVKGLRVGAALKSISRKSINEIYTPAEIAADNFDDIIEDDEFTKTGSSLDLGVIYTLPWEKYFKTDIALSGQNIPSIDFSDKEELPTEWILGVSIQKKINAFSLIAAFDYRDITKNLGSDDDMAKRIHMGAELKFKDFIAVRCGLNQGYPSFGASLDLWVLKFDAAVYSEEIGFHAGQKEDKRYMGQISIGW